MSFFSRSTRDSGHGSFVALVQVHDAQYVQDFCAGTLPAASLRRIGLPWSPVLVERTLAEVAGTLLTAELALEYGLACNTAGGTHTRPAVLVPCTNDWCPLEKMAGGRK
jgi:acetoin utilization deacetylase AcuC-like enzyme